MLLRRSPGYHKPLTLIDKCWASASPQVITGAHSSSFGATYSASAQFRKFARSHSVENTLVALTSKRAKANAWHGDALSYGWKFSYRGARSSYTDAIVPVCYVDSEEVGLLGALEYFMIAKADEIAVGGKAVTKGWHEPTTQISGGLTTTLTFSHWA